MTSRTLILCFAIVIFLLASVSCGQVEKPAQPAASTPFSFETRLGWFNGPCLAISNPNLAAGTAVSLIFTSDPQKVAKVQIQGPIKDQPTSAATCPALLEGRAKANAKPGTSFYALQAASLGTTDMGIGVVTPPANLGIVNGLAQVDLDRDGKSEVFAACATSEGIKFTVWAGKAYNGEPRWSRYYYLDYDLTPNCP